MKREICISTGPIGIYSLEDSDAVNLVESIGHIHQQCTT
jgi:hypothetical protein